MQCKKIEWYRDQSYAIQMLPWHWLKFDILIFEVNIEIKIRYPLSFVIGSQFTLQVHYINKRRNLPLLDINEAKVTFFYPPPPPPPHRRFINPLDKFIARGLTLSR